MKEFLSIPMSYAGGSYWITAGFTPTLGGIYYYTPDSGTTYYACVSTFVSGTTANAIPSATNGTFTSGAGNNAFSVLGVIPKLTTAAWGVSTVYKTGDYVTASSKLYVCGVAGTSTGSAPTTTTKGTLDGTGAQFYYVGASLLATSATSTQLTGAAWTSATDLYVGDIVYYGQDAYAVIATTAAATSTAAKLPIPARFGPTSQYYQYLFTLGGQMLIGFEGITTVEVTSSTILTINSQLNATNKATKLYFQVADSTYATHQAVMQSFNDAFTKRKGGMFSSYRLPALPITGSGANPNWVSAVFYS